MSTAPQSPTPTPAPNRPPRRVYPKAPDNSKRDMLIAVGSGLLLLAVVIGGIIGLSGEPGKPSKNFLSGTIVAKNATGERIEEIQVGKSGVKKQETDSGYSFDVKVEPSGKVYEVPVTKEVFLKKKVGDVQEFIRPPSEQTY